MRKLITLFAIFILPFGTTLRADDNTFLDYQNYNHGYCPDCNCEPCGCDAPCPPDVYCEAPCDPCDPCAPVCGAACGISVCAIAVGVAALVAAGAIILASGDGSSSVEHGAS